MQYGNFILQFFLDYLVYHLRPYGISPHVHGPGIDHSTTLRTTTLNPELDPGITEENVDESKTEIMPNNLVGDNKTSS